MIKAVRIHDISIDVGDEVCYVARSLKDCKDSVDREVFGLVMKFKDFIEMGCVVGEPIFS